MAKQTDQQGAVNTEEPLLTDFLKRATPFGSLKVDRLHLLAERIHRLSLQRGDTVIREGEKADSCFLVRTGRVEVIQKEKGQERQLAVLEAGALFGETALLTESTRNATVRALEKTELLELKREDFMKVIGESHELRLGLFELLSLRDRPSRLREIEEHPANADDNTPITTLVNRERGTYFRLTPQGYFIWRHLDGYKNLKDLTLLYLKEFGLFAPHSIAETISGLVASGFAKSRTTRATFLLLPSWGQKVWIGARYLFEWRLILRDVDPILSTLHRLFLPLFSRWGQLLIGSVVVFGFFIFLKDLLLHASLLDFRKIPHVVPTVILLFVLSAIFHEAGHALATKSFGRRVLGIGIGWNWLTPILFVDTSDMWLARRWQRIVVSLAGPYTHLILSGIASILSLFLEGTELRGPLWLFAAGSYLLFLMNLLPVLNFDGHYVWRELTSS